MVSTEKEKEEGFIGDWGFHFLVETRVNSWDLVEKRGEIGEELG